MNRIMIVALVASALASAPAAAGSFSNYTVIHSFCAEADCADGAVPYSALAIDGSGTIYGTTKTGGAANAGAVFMLKPDKKRQNWTYSVLHSFCTGDCADGKHPYGGLILDTSGNIYGTTSTHGVAFRLNPNTQQFDILHGVGDSYAPLTFKGSTFDGHSTLYGTVASGGAYRRGAVFALRPRDDGTWRRDLLWSFCASGKHCTDGARPYGGVAVSEHGLIGIATKGGPDKGHGGVIYQLANREMAKVDPLCTQFCFSGDAPKFVTPMRDPLTSPEAFFIPEREVLIEYDSFGMTNWGTFDPGHNALAGAVEGPDGSYVFGTTSKGGNTGIDPEGGGIVWAFGRITHGLGDIHRFCQEAGCVDGARPAATLVHDPSSFSRFYGTTTEGGEHSKGVLFEIVPTLPPS